MSDATLKYGVIVDVSGAITSIKSLDGTVKTMANDIRTNLTGGLVNGFKNLGLGIFGVQQVLGTLQRTLGSFIKEAIDAEQGMSKVEQALVSTGNASGYTANQLKSIADQLERTTATDADDIMNRITLPLLTFTSITRENLPDAQLAVLNMSRALGTDLQGAAMQVGKALQDPTVGLTALRRSGVSFSDAQVEVIRKLQETGHVAEAQKLIIKELGIEFGGQAEKYTGTYAGQLESFNVSWKNLKETIGTGLLPVLSELASRMSTAMNIVKDGEGLWWLGGSDQKSVEAETNIWALRGRLAETQAKIGNDINKRYANPDVFGDESLTDLGSLEKRLKDRIDALTKVAAKTKPSGGGGGGAVDTEAKAQREAEIEAYKELIQELSDLRKSETVLLEDDYKERLTIITKETKKGSDVQKQQLADLDNWKAVEQAKIDKTEADRQAEIAAKAKETADTAFYNTQKTFTDTIDYYSNLHEMGVTSWDTLKKAFEDYYAWAKENLPEREQEIILAQLRQVNLRWGKWKEQQKTDAVLAWEEQNQIFIRSFINPVEAGYRRMWDTLLDIDMSGKRRREAIWDAMKSSFVGSVADMTAIYIKNEFKKLFVTEVVEGAKKKSLLGTFALELGLGIKSIALSMKKAAASVYEFIAKQLAANAFLGPFAIGIAAGAGIAALAMLAGFMKFNQGGQVPGRGSGDTVPALLTPGEFVSTKKATAMFLPQLRAMNQAAGKSQTGVSGVRNGRYADGGMVSGGSGGDIAGELIKVLKNSTFKFDFSRRQLALEVAEGNLERRTW